MTLREEIAEKRKELWRDSDAAELEAAQELIVDRIDILEQKIDDMESAVVN